MSDIVNFSSVEDKIIILRDIPVILDSDVAELYGVETKRINEAVKNNPDKFPEGYIWDLSSSEWQIMKSKFSTSLSPGGKVKLPKAFSEKGLYMLATILKSERATQTTIAIVETFAKIRELSRTVAQLSESPDEFAQKSLMHKSGDIIADLLGDDLKTSDTETSIELNFAVLKFKHTIKRKNEKSKH
jgi:ORF6N domain.